VNTKVTTIPPQKPEMYSPAINDGAFQAFCESTKLISLSSSLSAKYNMKPLDAVYQSLPSKFEKLMKRPPACLLDTNMLDPSYDSKKSGVPGKYSLDFDGAFMMSNGAFMIGHHKCTIKIQTILAVNSGFLAIITSIQHVSV